MTHSVIVCAPRTEPPWPIGPLPPQLPGKHWWVINESILSHKWTRMNGLNGYENPALYHFCCWVSKRVNDDSGLRRVGVSSSVGRTCATSNSPGGGATLAWWARRSCSPVVIGMFLEPYEHPPHIGSHGATYLKSFPTDGLSPFLRWETSPRPITGNLVMLLIIETYGPYSMTLYLVVRRELYEADGRYSYLKFIHN